MPRPVDIARALAAYGLSLRKANDVLNRLAAGESVAVDLQTSDKGKLARSFSRLGVAARFVNVPPVDVRRIREGLGLSQAEFATRFGLELDTVRNWEQGRNTPDAPTRTLLKIIETNPNVVEAVLESREKQRS